MRRAAAAAGRRCCRTSTTTRCCSARATTATTTRRCPTRRPGWRPCARAWRRWLVAPGGTPVGCERARFAPSLARRASRLFALGDLLEAAVADRVLAPVLVVEVPPLRLVDGEPLLFHRPPQQV